MSYYRNNGSFKAGVFTIVCIFAAFIAGYVVRDNGVIFKIDGLQQKPVQQQKQIRR